MCIRKYLPTSKRRTMAGLSALYLEYCLLSSTIFHYLSLPVIEYHCLSSLERMNISYYSLERVSIVSYYLLERASIVLYYSLERVSIVSYYSLERASIVSYYSLERASIISISLHPYEFLRSRVTGQSTSGSACMRLPFPSRTYVRTDTTNCKYMCGQCRVQCGMSLNEHMCMTQSCYICISA